jgi:Protein of unknown function (DUF3108)
MQATPLLSVQSSAEGAAANTAANPAANPAAKRVLLAALLLVLVLHGAFLSDWVLGASGKPPPEVPPSRLIQFREVTLPAAAPSPSPAATPTRDVSPAQVRPARQRPSERPTAAALPEPTSDPLPTPVPAVVASPQEPQATAVLQAASEPAPATTTDASGVQAWPGVDSDTPVYRVTLPPGFKQGYVLRRGPLTGTAELSWAPAGGRYELSLSGSALVFSLVQHSKGRLDATGLEPERFTTKATGRAELATNFQREEGVISFSGPSRRYAWRLGAQDRLSVYVQLAAILAAESSRLAQGQRFALPVVSERGDADVWTLRIVAWEDVATASGEVRAVRLVREVRKPNDQAAEIWMDEKRHYIPVRIRLGNEDANRWELLRD